MVAVQSLACSLHFSSGRKSNPNSPQHLQLAVSGSPHALFSREIRRRARCGKDPGKDPVATTLTTTLAGGSHDKCDRSAGTSAACRPCAMPSVVIITQALLRTRIRAGCSHCGAGCDHFGIGCARCGRNEGRRLWRGDWRGARRLTVWRGDWRLARRLAVWRGDRRLARRLAR